LKFSSAVVWCKTLVGSPKSLEFGTCIRESAMKLEVLVEDR